MEKGIDGKYIMLGLTIVAMAFSLIKVSSHPDDCSVFFNYHVLPSLWPPCVADVDLCFCHVVSSIFLLLFFFPRLILAVAE